MSIKDFWKLAVDDLKPAHLKDEWLALRPSVRMGIIGVALIILLSLVAQCAHAQTGVTVSLSADPADGVETVTPTLTWSSSGAVSCEATGGWSGTKATSGSETLPPIVRTTNFGLSCSAADGWAELSWTAPTEYTNGDPLPLSDLGGFKAYYGLAGGALSSVVDVPDENATSYRIEGLSAGNHSFQMTAYTDGSVESERSVIVSKVIEVPASSSEATVTVQLKPKPPVLTTVQNFVYGLRTTKNGDVKLAKRVGTIAFGVPCGDTPIVQRGKYTYYEVPAQHVSPSPDGTVVAACAAI